MIEAHTRLDTLEVLLHGCVVYACDNSPFDTVMANELSQDVLVNAMKSALEMTEEEKIVAIIHCDAADIECLGLALNAAFVVFAPHIEIDLEFNDKSNMLTVLAVRKKREGCLIV